jgi:hypothetical protein
MHPLLQENTKSYHSLAAQENCLHALILLQR